MTRSSKFVAAAAIVVGLAVTASAQDKKVTVADFVGTWNIELMSHQIALVIEPADGDKVSATMMIMGNDTPLKGELVEKTLTLVGVKKDGDDPNPHMQVGAKPITVVMEEDGTIAGELMTGQGPMKFTGEKLKTKKKS